MNAAEPFFDTNVLVYAFDRDAPEKRRISLQLIERYGRNDRITLSSQVLQEFFAVVTRKLAQPLPIADARAALLALSAYRVVRLDTDAILAAVDLCEAESLSLWDALIVDAAQRAGCDVLYSEDLQHGHHYGRLRIVNPFG